ncbi:hypothetical protein GCM10017673_42320 [Streptosporangium violaceochromogenes]|nr:hypothetical protein GCM10017673_42320 [Streptosporangium violaceochromogenes]
MTRSEFDDIRAHIDAEANHPGDLLMVARSLVSDLEDARKREATLRAQYLRLLIAARASVAAQATGSADPLSFLADELAKWGQLPTTDEEMTQVLMDAQTGAALLAGLTRPARAEQAASTTARNGPRVHRCLGTSRTLPR